MSNSLPSGNYFGFLCRTGVYHDLTSSPAVSCQYFLSSTLFSGFKLNFESRENMTLLSSFKCCSFQAVYPMVMLTDVFGICLWTRIQTFSAFFLSFRAIITIDLTDGGRPILLVDLWVFSSTLLKFYLWF